MRRLRTAAATAVTAALALPGAASAGTPFTLGMTATTAEPTITAGAPGVFHVVWNDAPGDSLRYCQVLAGSKGCARTAVIAYPDALGPAGRAFVLTGATPDVLHVVQAQYAFDDTYVWTSLNGGQSFTGPVQVYAGANGTNESRPLLRPATASVAVPTWNPSLLVHERPLDGSGVATPGRAALAGASGRVSTYNLELADVGTGVLATADDLTEIFFWQAPNGAPLSVTPSWGTATAFGRGLDSTMHGGPAGTHVAYTTRNGGTQLIMRRWGGMAFGPLVTVAKEPGYLASVYTSPNGTPGVAYRRNGTGLRYATSPDKGIRYTSKTIVSDDDVIFFELGLARDDTGRGLVVWRDGTAIRAADLTEVPDPTEKPLTVTKSSGAYKVSVTVPGGCIPAGATFTASAASLGKGKVRYAKLKLGGKIKQDNSAPYSALLLMPKGAKPGATARVQAAIRFKGTPKDKTVGVEARVRACGG